MATIFPSLFGRTKSKPRIKEGMQDQRRYELYRAGCRLLARHDHEQISVAQIARAAGISVGAFYQRFPDKDAFLGRVVSHRLSGARERMERELDPERWQRRSTGAVTQAIVKEMMRGLHGPGAGVVRAALKRGYTDRTKLEPLLHYRAALADRAVALLAHRAKHVKKPERAVRAAMQMAEAMALDALLHDEGTLRPGSWRMVDALSAMMLGMLGLSGGPVADDGHGDDDTAKRPDDDDAMLDMPVEDVIAEPIPEPARSQKTKAARKNPVAEPIKIIQPTASAPQEPEKTEPPPRKRRHRPRF